MERARPRFSVAVHMYFWMFLFFLVILPIAAVRAAAIRMPVSTAWWVFAAIWPAMVAGIFFYARSRCSSESIVYKDGLMWVASSMMTGWVQLSFVTVMPTLLLAYFASLFFAAEADLRRDPTIGSAKWLEFVRFFYEHRLRR